MKKTYIQPKMKAVALKGPSMMTSGSYTVTKFRRSDDKNNYDITIGDTDDE